MSPNVKMVSFVADEDGGQRRFANTTVSRHNNPAWFSARASCRGIFHTCMSFNQPVPPAASVNCVFCGNIWGSRADNTGHILLRKQRSKVLEKRGGREGCSHGAVSPFGWQRAKRLDTARRLHALIGCRLESQRIVREDRLPVPTGERSGLQTRIAATDAVRLPAEEV